MNKILQKAIEGGRVGTVREKVLVRAVEDMRLWISQEGERSNICTYAILGRTVCSTCNCDRRAK